MTSSRKIQGQYCTQKMPTGSQHDPTRGIREQDDLLSSTSASKSHNFKKIMFRSAFSRIPPAHLVTIASMSAFGVTTCGIRRALAESSPEPKIAISKKEFTPLVVSKNEVVGENVHKITLDFENKTDVLGMKTAGMLMVRGAKRDAGPSDKPIARPYTPVSRNDTPGKLELVVKDYPGRGNVSSFICAAEVGSSLSVKGCYDKIEVKPNKWKKIGLIAGGSGITPCLQVAEELLSSPDDTTEITLIFCNQTPGAIFLKDRIDALAAKSNGRFRVHYCVDKADDDTPDWTGLTGYVTADMVQKHLPPPSNDNDNIIMVCGPPPMYAALCGPKKFEKGKPPAQGELSGILKDLGFTPDSVFKF